MSPHTSVQVEEAVRQSLERALGQTSWASFTLGAPPASERWLGLPDIDAAAIEALLDRQQADTGPGTTRQVVGNFAFRYLLYAPLMLAGYLFAAERRVVRFDRMWHRDTEWMQHVRAEGPRLVVMPGDDLAGEDGVEIVHEAQLADALFAEVERVYGPLMRTFRAPRYVAVPNGWGTILDALVQGLAPAANAVGYDEAWRRWDQAVAGRAFPVRRRPLRFSLDIDGLRDELAVRAGCCLWFMTPAAIASDQKYCVSCYLMPDQDRTRIRRDSLRSQQVATDS